MIDVSDIGQLDKDQLLTAVVKHPFSSVPRSSTVVVWVRPPFKRHSRPVVLDVRRLPAR